MEPPPFLFFLLCLFTSHHLQQATSSPHNHLTDLSSLLSFKATLIDPHRVLSTTWTPNTSFCTWPGIHCTPQSQRVAAIQLPDLSLHGTISPHLSNLSFLSHLNLTNNSLSGPIPQSLHLLPRLAVLSIAQNRLSGSIPPDIFNMTSLVEIHLARNNLSGPLVLPSNQSQSLPQLRYITVSENQLTGEIPLGFGGCRGLQKLSLAYNELSGTIPAELGNLAELTILYLGRNQLTGTIPTSLGNLTSLEELDLSYNNIEGLVPDELGNLKNLQYLAISANALTGPIPAALLNASMLNSVVLNKNSLTGSVPIAIGKSWPLLAYLDIEDNRLTGGLDFISSLSYCRDLQSFAVGDNQLQGVLQNSVGNLSANLEYFYASGNRIKGTIPEGFSNLSSLVILSIGYNELTGVIPPALARLKRLQGLYLKGNKLEGSIPFEIGLMTSLNMIYLDANRLSGPIPDSMSNMSSMQYLSLADNALSSSIPRSLWGLGGLVDLILSRNALEGSLPIEVSNLRALDTLDLSTNRLSGNIPSALGELQMLTYLDLSNNSFQAQIPESLGGLISIKYLNLSHNSLSGAIPKSLANLHFLRQLDLSYNKIGGQIPKGRIFSNLSSSSLAGNAALCGAPQLHFPPCSVNDDTSNSKAKLVVLRYILPAIAIAIAFAVILFACLCANKNSNKATVRTHDDSPSVNDHRLISYHELVRATDNFSETNLLGRGSFGSVFKGCLDDGLLAAVKVLNLEVEGASRSFAVECSTLSTLRHRNLIKIISTCSNLDFKALVLEFMVNGSLDKWLYSADYYLNLLQRINIMVDVSSALEYLHHYHPEAMVHCDLKPSNVLLDEDMTAHVADFGIAKLLLVDGKSVATMSTPGTIGYMAPEYGLSGKASRRGDVYSFGILLLETFTRKKPTDAIFNGESSLRQWVSNAYPAAILKIVDPDLLRDDSTGEQQSNLEVMSTLHQCLESIIELGLLCSRDSPRERLVMKDVVPKLERIRGEYVTKLTSASSSKLPHGCSSSMTV